MKAITLWQPWATMAVLGIKQHETRSWPTKYRGQLLIHAAARFERAWLETVVQAIEHVLAVDVPRPLHRFINSSAYRYPGAYAVGALVGFVDVTDCYAVESAHSQGLDAALGDYSAGRWAWQLQGAVPFANPIPCRGRQGFWNYEPGLK